MAINKIKIQQIDADLSGFIYNASTGFFVQTGDFYNFSGQALTKTDFYNEKIVFSTGNQNISGIKNFSSRPLFNNQPLSLQSEGIQTTGIQDIDGRKNFRSGAYFYQENVFSNSDVVYNQSSLKFTGNSTFSFEAQSASNFANSLSDKILLLGEQQTVTGPKNFSGGFILSSGDFVLSGSSLINENYLTNGQSIISGSGLAVRSLTILNTVNTTSKIADFNSTASLCEVRLYCPISGGSGQVPATRIRSNNIGSTSSFPQTTFTFPTGGLFFQLEATGVGGGANNPVIETGSGFAHRSFFGFGYNNIRIFNMALSGCSGQGGVPPFISSGDNTTAAFFPSWGYAGSGTLGTGSLDAVGKNIALGLPLYRWSDMYSYNAPNIVSDRNSKSFVSPIPDEWLDIWENINYCRYKFNSAIKEKGAANARWHFGMIAQDIFEEFQKSGMNAFELGLIGKNSWGNQYDENGNLVKLSGELFSIRADECQFMELALMRREINRLKSGIY